LFFQFSGYFGYLLIYSRFSLFDYFLLRRGFAGREDKSNKPNHYDSQKQKIHRRMAKNRTCACVDPSNEKKPPKARNSV
jgi:uncharacterized surface anchored protein